MNNYDTLYQKAYETTTKLGLKAPSTKTFNDQTYIAQWLMYEIGLKIAELFTQDEFIEFMRQPLSAVRLHVHFKPIIDELLKVNSAITVGSVKVANDAGDLEEFAFIEEAAFKESLENKKMPEKLHAWITLPSSEIIDLAFMTIYGLIYNEPTLFGNLVAKAPEDLTGGMQYIPLLLGEEFFAQVQFDTALPTKM